MATPSSSFPSSKETTNYARLCRLLVDVGSQVLRSTFDKIHPPATLHTVLGKASVHHATLQSLYKGKKKVLNPTQWGKLYPAHSPVSSATFDITLLTVLLRNICGLSPPVTGWDHLPLAANKSITDDIARVKYYRNTVYGHASQASVNDTVFSSYWQEIREALVRLGGAHFRADIDNLEHDCMDPDIEEHYRELMKQWKNDDDSIKNKLEKMEASIKDSMEKIIVPLKTIMEKNVRDTAGKIESELKEVKEKLGSLTASVEKSTEEGGAKFALAQMKSEIEKMDSGMNDVKENLSVLTDSVKETKDEEGIKQSLKQIRDEMDTKLTRMEIEMKELKEKLCKRTVSAEEFKSGGAFDLTELIDGIRQLYKIREGWLSPFPWCEEFQFFVGDIFTRLKLVRRKKTRGDVTDKIITMSSLLNPHEECSEPRTVLIEGKPGMGKTTYCKKFVYDWATKKQNPEDFVLTIKVVLLLKCRDIKSDIWEAIDDQLLPRDLEEGAKQQFFQFIRDNQSSILLILDGLDELPCSEGPWISEMIAGRLLPKCYIVATARHEAGVKLRKCFDTLLEVEGFTQAQARAFIAKYFKEKSQLAEKLSVRISSDEILQEMCANPLNTALLCLLCEEFGGNLPENRTKLYLDMIECVLRRYRKKKELPDTKEDLTDIYKSQLKTLGLIALNGLIDDKLDFDENELEEHPSDLAAFGFLSVQPGGSKLRPSLRYAFLHKCFQECFAAFYICCEIQDKKITPEKLVSDERYFSKLRQVLLFSCGILAEQSDQQAAVLVSSIGHWFNDPDDGNMKGVEVVLEAINECKRKRDDFHLQLARYFGSNITKKELVCMQTLGMELLLILSETIKVNKTLTHLRLCCDLSGDAGAISIAEAIKVNKTLTNFHLSVDGISDAGVTFIAEGIKGNKTLTTLDLSANQISDAGATSIAEAIKVNKTLTDLNLTGNCISDAGATSIAEAIKVNGTLTYLTLFHNQISDAGATSIAEAIKVNKTLANLDLIQTKIGDAGAISIAEAIKVNKTLTNLWLCENQITDAGATCIAEGIKVNKTLTNLNLLENQIRGAGATYIAEAIKVNKTLTSLNLFRNQISDAGVTSIAEAMKVNKTLTNLNLSGNEISDGGATSIAEAIKVNKTLTNLVLSCGRISKAGATYIAEAIKVNKTLTSLKLYRNQISDISDVSVTFIAEAVKVNKIDCY
ncbi:nucleotide-binding oligomerization domain-containing protein 2-like [Stylophora pistillata]|nr:nucleotide-binding oligomerization domain-containing protein 2-like [Stylophora pistillata]XP_022805288.1 nucleotide-binding oligomerization domain-containing protein 2-like [Stylophora pistillata]